MKYQITDDVAFPLVRFDLQQGEKIKAESGAMVAMRSRARRPRRAFISPPRATRTVSSRAAGSGRLRRLSIARCAMRARNPVRGARRVSAASVRPACQSATATSDAARLHAPSRARSQIFHRISVSVATDRSAMASIAGPPRSIKARRASGFITASVHASLMRPMVSIQSCAPCNTAS